MEKYIVSKDFLLWSEKKRLILDDCVGQIHKILKGNESNKLENIEMTIKEYNVKGKENAEFFNNSDLTNLEGFPIQYYGDPKLIDLLNQILGIQQE